MAHSCCVFLSPDLVHSIRRVLLRPLIHSFPLVLLRFSIHFDILVLSRQMIHSFRTEHPFYAHAQREQIHKVQGRAVGSGACTMLRADG